MGGGKRTLFSPQEVALHASEDDCWLVMSDRRFGSASQRAQVYNVTAFLPHHPGGKDLLLAMATSGRDCGSLFEEMEHSEQARTLAREYCIGELLLPHEAAEEGEEQQSLVKNDGPSNEDDDDDNNDRLNPNAPANLDFLDRIAGYCIVVLFILDLITTGLVLWTIRNPLECCNEDIYDVYDDRQFIITVAIAFLVLIVLEAVFHFSKRTSWTLMVLNPVFSSALTFALIASTNYVEAIFTVVLESVSLALEIYAIWSLRYRRSHETDDFCCKNNQRRRNTCMRVVQGISVLLILANMIVLVEAIHQGGVCIRDEDGAYRAASRAACGICPSTGLAVTDTTDDSVPICPEPEETPLERMEFCGNGEDDNVIRFCFFPLSIL